MSRGHENYSNSCNGTQVYIQRNIYSSTAHKRGLEEWPSVKQVHWYTDGSKTEEGGVAGIYVQQAKVLLAVIMSKDTTVFQVYIYSPRKLGKPGKNSQ